MTEILKQDMLWMELALSLAQTAYRKDEVPVGAVIIKNGQLISTGFNLREANHCATDHAEIRAIQKASQHLKSWRLVDCELYVTLEPCLMCAGALQQARIKRVVFAAHDPKAGALASLYQIQNDDRLNHRFEVTSGVLEEKSATLLKDFFRKKRASKKRPES